MAETTYSLLSFIHILIYIIGVSDMFFFSILSHQNGSFCLFVVVVAVAVAIQFLFEAVINLLAAAPLPHAFKNIAVPKP